MLAWRLLLTPTALTRWAPAVASGTVILTEPPPVADALNEPTGSARPGQARVTRSPAWNPVQVIVTLAPTLARVSSAVQVGAGSSAAARAPAGLAGSAVGRLGRRSAAPAGEASSGSTARAPPARPASSFRREAVPAANALVG